MITRLIKALKKKGGFEGFLWKEITAMPGVIIVITSQTFVLTWANDYFYDYFKCLPEDTLGKPMYDFLGEDIQGDMSEEHILSLLKEGQAFRYPAKTSNAEGEEVTIRWNQRVFTDSEGKQWILSVGTVEEETTKRVYGFEEDVAPMPMITPRAVSQKDNEQTEAELDPEFGKLVTRENFIVHYQPKVSARTKMIIGAEALIRMKHPERGLIYPGAFLPQVEKTGYIIKIGEYVIEAACKKLMQWQDMKNGLPLSVSVNVSPRQFCDANFVQGLLATVSRYRIEPKRLMLEMAERDVAEHFNEAKLAMQTLKDAGFMVAIDDYNTAFLPLYYLAQLAVDDIAIDRMYLAQTTQNPKIYPIIESIIMLAHGLNMSVTARGVETRKQLEFMMENSVNFLQGYLISEPLPEAEFDRFLDINPDFYTRHI